MKPYIFLLILFFISATFIQSGNAQTDKSTRPSPPRETKGTYQDAQVVINYSSPFIKGRTIWGELVPYGKVWRTGANEATIFETDKDLIIQDKKLPAGKYALFTIPGEKEWIWIFNSEWDQWGAFKYDVSKDVLRVQSIPQPSPVYHEQLAFTVSHDRVSLYWENLSVSF
ncbi:MAG TPA: DUF2911 domain-containing protein [Saprospiraceae bacterium]